MQPRVSLCPNCHSQIALGQQFCVNCGARFCPHCRTAVPTRSRFCPNCGFLLGTAQPREAAQPPPTAAAQPPSPMPIMPSPPYQESTTCHTIPTPRSSRYVAAVQLPSVWRQHRHCIRAVHKLWPASWQKYNPEDAARGNTCCASSKHYTNTDKPSVATELAICCRPAIPRRLYHRSPA